MGLLSLSLLSLVQGPEITSSSFNSISFNSKKKRLFESVRSRVCFSIRLTASVGDFSWYLTCVFN